MSANDALTFDERGRVRFHESCTSDANQPTFEDEWQRRAFGLAVALAEFGHYPWADFQRELIDAIGSWESDPTQDSWVYYEHWVGALESVVRSHGLLDEEYVGPRERDDHT